LQREAGSAPGTAGARDSTSAHRIGRGDAQSPTGPAGSPIRSISATCAAIAWTLRQHHPHCGSFAQAIGGLEQPQASVRWIRASRRPTVVSSIFSRAWRRIGASS